MFSKLSFCAGLMLRRIPGENIQSVPKFVNILETLRRFLPQESVKIITGKSSYFAQQYKRQEQTQIVFEILRCRRCEQFVAPEFFYPNKSQI
jgi:hypothetical protein